MDQSWLSPSFRVWFRRFDAYAPHARMATALKSLHDRGIPDDIIAANLDNYLGSLEGTPYPPNLFRFAETFGKWNRPVAKKADTFPWPEGDPRWHDPAYTDTAISFYTKGAQ